jgi:hypothetical protein
MLLFSRHLLGLGSAQWGTGRLSMGWGPVCFRVQSYLMLIFCFLKKEQKNKRERNGRSNHRAFSKSRP